MLILAIETSCDETACAVVKDGTQEICSVVASSKEFHEKTGGIVPEVAARKQVEFITPVINETFNKLSDKGYSKEDIDAVGVTVGPGLIGSLIVGIEAAKALSLALNKPLIPVNHLLGHIYANFVDNEAEIKFPGVVLVVSGGHTDLVLMKGHNDFEFLGGTLDDASGEAFDKVARLLGLSKYLGGRVLSETAEKCKENTIEGRLPRPMIDSDNYDFSFSGLKTAVKRLVEKEDLPTEVVAREFENAVVDVLVKKTSRAIKNTHAKSVLLGGGVAANKHLRESMETLAEKIKVDLYIPTIRLCTDNAVVIGSTAYFNQVGKPLDEIQPNPSLGIMDLV
ncbi:tRNA (adenosine(37)-N6)-threonylcarbamoyltransferase complex transferase subunit TsaD [Patescibacteria group bacterium]|nr:tRNA (adenosine(37)-N6)-threonylcarbamoyltransferase complex transferase subunit TsaD [Patescibacteria group bacterium]